MLKAPAPKNQLSAQRPRNGEMVSEKDMFAPQRLGYADGNQPGRRFNWNRSAAMGLRYRREEFCDLSRSGNGAGV